MNESKINSNNSRGLMNKELREKFSEKIDDWFGGSEFKYEIIFCWIEGDGAVGEAHICVETKSPVGLSYDTKEPIEWVTQLYFLTLFTIGDRIEISQDKQVEIKRS